MDGLILCYYACVLLSYSMGGLVNKNIQEMQHPVIAVQQNKQKIKLFGLFQKYSLCCTHTSGQYLLKNVFKYRKVQKQTS